MDYELPEPYDGVYDKEKLVDVFTPEQMQAAHAAGRASRDAEVESVRADRDALHKAWESEFGERSFGEVKAEVEALRADAKRYQWLRMRIKVKPMQAVSGTFREAIDVKIGCAFLDSDLPTTYPASYPIEQAEKLDQAIDSAIAAKE